MTTSTPTKPSTKTSARFIRLAGIALMTAIMVLLVALSTITVIEGIAGR